METPSTGTCDAILKTGKRAGKVCGNKGTRQNGTKCGRHAKSDKVVIKVKKKAAVVKKKKKSPCLGAPSPPSDAEASDGGEGEDTEDLHVAVSGASASRFISIENFMTPVHVCNVAGSSKDRAAWKTFYLKHSGTTFPAKCRAKDCERKAAVTGHLYLRNELEQKEVFFKHVTYNVLVPICEHHNTTAYDEPNFYVLKKNTVGVRIAQNPAVEGK